MSKEKKPTPKKLKPKDLIPDIDEYLNAEFLVPNVSLGQEFALDTHGEPDDKFDAWIKAVEKRAGKYFFQQGNLIAKCDHNLKILSTYLDKYPELFAEEYGEINRDMIKWHLYEHIKKCRAFIDKIQKIEKELELDQKVFARAVYPFTSPLQKLFALCYPNKRRAKTNKRTNTTNTANHQTKHSPEQKRKPCYLQR